MKVTTLFGPPGTGKTSEQLRILARIDRPALFLSFTKAGAQEAVSRLPEGSKVRPSTIHSFVFNAMGMTRASMVDAKKLAEYGRVAGVPFKGEELGVDEPQEGDEFAAVLEYANNRLMPLDEAYDHFGQPGTRHRFFSFVTGYQAWKREFGFMDFDDLLIRFMKDYKIECPPVVSLDEAQDCSPLQWQVFEKIVQSGAEQVFISGDDDQAIYAWNGADPHGMVKFSEEHGAKIRVLQQSWRVPRSVFDLTHRKVLGKIGTRAEKEFRPADRDGKVVHYGDFWDVNLNGFKGMILGRDRWRLDEIRRALNREMIPYEAPGLGSPWTSKVAQALRQGKTPEIPIQWREFYRQADLSRPIEISLSTIHQAKGREADNVILDLQMSTKVLNNIYKDRDAELRVMYVGLTRAAHKLILCGENPLI